MSDQSVHLFGIRHHGPGCARSLLRALEDLQPDCLLVEGPPDGEAVLPFLLDEALKPPVALLVYAPEEPHYASFYPFALFSPEWQALRYGLGRSLPVRFMDLPLAHQLALDKAEALAAQEAEAAAQAEAAEERGAAGEAGETPRSQGAGPAEGSSETAASTPPAAGASVEESIETAKNTPEAAPEEHVLPDHAEPCDEAPVLPDVHDPLDWLRRAAGYGDGEAWWNHMVEERSDGLELFAAIREAMTTLRAEAPRDGWGEAEKHREALREAHMRKCLRQAKKDGFQRIAVVCGAWHVPAFDAGSAKEDNALLKGLPKMKVAATWTPWTYHHLSRSSGYGAGVTSPAWYEHLWRAGNGERAVGWLSRAARLFREQDMDCSSAHIIEAARLATSLAALRDLPRPGLPELYEALKTVVCMGDEAPLRLIERELIVGDSLGSVPASAPTLPLQRDLERQQKSLRLKPEAAQKTIDLDLRQPNDLARSHLLHRLRLLDIEWGVPANASGNARGTFHEYWQTQWTPELALSVITASRWGGSVREAAAAKAVALSQEAQLLELAELVDTLLLADLPEAVEPVTHRLEEEAATASDVTQLLAALPPLAAPFRYGNVRGTDAGMVGRVLRGLVPRASIGLSGACTSLNDESAAALRDRVIAAHNAVRLIDDAELAEGWLAALRGLSLSGGSTHPLLCGLATRLLFDEQKLSAGEVAERMSLALSAAAAPADASAWIEGFLNQSSLVLLHDDILWNLLAQWLDGLTETHFTRIVPMLRRTFTAFSAPERRQLAERARRRTEGAAPIPGETTWDPIRAARPLPLLRRVLGLAEEASR
ncbi:DUF5682 family protein [uncultured Bilophila sp.]|uniref:DUF5682 family protein n=2 Tax=uncultured Bilophila sp. TaxID=529385 RepID=UPI002632AAED|nr:DUF5682 family protein [uncultured Bilophila sp.]